MKKTKKSNFKRICFVLCTAILSVVMTFTFSVHNVLFAFAKSDEYNNTLEKEADSNVESDDVYLENDILPNNVESNYTYSEPDNPLFLIKNVDGVLYFLNNVAYIAFQNYSLSIPNFDLYKIVDTEGNLRFYQADVSKNSSIDNPFAFLSIYLEEDYYIMYVQYGVEAEFVLYNIRISLTSEQFNLYASETQPLLIGDDEVSARLKASSKIYTQGSYSLSDDIMSEDVISNNVSTQSLNNIQANQYDIYTNQDGIIHSYVDNYFWNCKLSDGRTITDDPIVRIVPKELFFIPGEHIYVGKEYGFFVKVDTDRFNDSDYATGVMVFDITHITPSFPSNTTGSSKVTPLFEYKYRASDKERNSGNWSEYDPSLSRVVFPHVEYDYVDYFLNDIGFKFSVENACGLNPGDAGYDPYADDGAFIIQTRFNISGVGLKKKNKSFAADTAMFVFGFFPIVGTALSIYSYVHDLYDGFGNGNYFYKRESKILDNELQIHTYETNNTDQISARGNLIKSQSVSLTSDSEKPRLIHVGGGYAEGKYVVARKSGSNNNEIRIISSVSVNVIEDNTDLWIFGIQVGDTREWGRGTGTYETGKYKRLSNLNFNGGTSRFIDASSQRQVMKFIPNVSGSYKFETLSTSGDPHFRIINASKGNVHYALDDINGASNRNARLILDLIAGDTYFIDAFNYSSQYGYTLQMGYTPSSSTNIYKDTALNINVISKTYTMVKFTPLTSGYYDFFTKKTSGDPYLYLFDENGALLDSNDDGLGNLDSLIRYNVSADSVYYLAVRGYGSGAVNLALKVVPSITGRSAIYLDAPKDISVGTSTTVYEFTAPYTDSYDIYTYDIYSSGDPYLELYDSLRNKIAYDDDSNGGRNSLITVMLTAGQKYYVHARSFNQVTSRYTVKIRLSIYNRATIIPDLTSSAHIANDANEVKVYKFTASESRYYTIYTNNIVTGDPYLQIMDANGTIVYYDDDGAGNLNSKINFFAEAGETFYIIASSYKSDIACEYNLIIN